MSVKNSKITQLYADAFLGILPKNSLDELIDDLNFLSSVLVSSPELKNLLTSPLVPAHTKKHVLKSVFSEKIDIRIIRFLMVLCDRNRILFVDSIVFKAVELAYRAAFVEVVKLSLPAPLNSAQQDSVISKLLDLTGAERVNLVTEIAPDLIGGFKVQIGMKVIDMSIKGQLKRLSSHLNSFALQ